MNDLAIEVTSPDHKWLGNAEIKESPTSAISILLGFSGDKRVSLKIPENEDVTSRLRREIQEMQPTLFIFELKDGKWHSIPVEKLGTEYYLLDGFLAANFLNNIYRCDSNEDQRKYLTDAGIFIGEEEPVLM